MKFGETTIAGVFEIDLERAEDERGFFARSFCMREFAARGLNPLVNQCSLSYSAVAGTLRGMHYQAPPHAEAKLVRCVRGAIYDVALDLRPSSPTFRRWHASELSAENRRMLYIPEGCAHGFQTLTDDTEVLYQISAAYVPAAARRLRWNDPAFDIRWPAAVSCISPDDAAQPDWSGGAGRVW